MKLRQVVHIQKIQHLLFIKLHIIFEKKKWCSAKYQVCMGRDYLLTDSINVLKLVAVMNNRVKNATIVQ